MESQFSRESQTEGFMTNNIRKLFSYDEKFLRKYNNYKETRSVPIDVTWEMMKKDYHWGYRKGSAIDPLITWIYLRPDIKDDLDKQIININNLAKQLELNKHYFLVEKKAIAYLKCHCTTITTGVIDADDDSLASNDESIDYQSLKRQKRIRGIDDEAKEV